MKKILLLVAISMCFAGSVFAQSAKGDKGIPNAPGQTSCASEIHSLSSKLSIDYREKSKFSKVELDAISSLQNNSGQIGSSVNPDTPSNCAQQRKFITDKIDFIQKRITSK